MLQVTAQTKILVAIQPVDFRKGIDGLAALCKHKLKGDPFSGTLFLFRNRTLSSIKILVYDGQGFWLCTKRLSKGRLTWWPKTSADVGYLSAKDLTVLLWNGNPESAKLANDWRKIPFDP